MYHYITIWGLTIHMTGLGIVVFLATFLAIVHFEAQKQQVDAKEFFAYVPLYIVIIYLAGSYVYYLIDQFVILPFSVRQLLLYITPYKYAFHSIGITLGALAGGWKFLKNKSAEQKRKRINIWAYALLWASIPLGVFLLLGDTFIGKATEGGLYVSAIRSDSDVAIYDKVYPLGLALSVVGALGGGLMYIIGRKTHPYWGYLALSLFSFALSVIFLFQQYPRRLVSSIGGVTLDIKQYFFLIVAIGFYVLWFTLKKQRD